MKVILLLFAMLILPARYSIGQTLAGFTTNKHSLVVLNESTIVRDESGKKISYPIVQKLVTEGNSLDPVYDYMGVIVSYRIHPRKNEALVTSAH
jgi:hypothetical protein